MNFFQNLAALFTYKEGAPLIFSSGDFLLLFTVFLIIYTLIIKKKLLVSLYVVAFSFFFYYKSSGNYIWILILTTVLSYYSGKFLYQARSLTAKKIWTFAGILPPMLLLAYFKYTNFIIFNFSQIIGSNFALFNIILPVGISFYTFQSASYIIDLYRKNVEPAKDIIDYSFYLTFFPQLVAGPIIKANYFIPQLSVERKVTLNEVYSGLWMIIIGLVKKGVLADYIAGYNDLIFNAPQSYSGFENLMAVYGYALQIFCDFSGYSDMAIGLGKIMGFDLGINFNSPYKSLNISDFWKRWHISLSSWLMEYLYIPLGGNRTLSAFSLFSVPSVLVMIVLMRNPDAFSLSAAVVLGVMGLIAFKKSNNSVFTYIELALLTIMSVIWFQSCLPAAIYCATVLMVWIAALAFPSIHKQIATNINLLLTMLIGGLWHGAAWKFIFWGGIHGLALGVHKIFRNIIPDKKIFSVLGWIFTFHFVVLLWIFFRAGDITVENVNPDGTSTETVIDAVKVPFLMLDKIFTDFDINFASHFWDARYIWVIMVLAGFVFHFVPVNFSNKVRDWFVLSPLIVKLLILVVVCQLVVQFRNETVQPFIYFNF